MADEQIFRSSERLKNVDVSLIKDENDKVQEILGCTTTVVPDMKLRRLK